MSSRISKRHQLFSPSDYYLRVQLSYQVFLCAALLFGPTATGQPTEWVVDQDGSGDFKHVQGAINAVHDLRKARTANRLHPGLSGSEERRVGKMDVPQGR